MWSNRIPLLLVTPALAASCIYFGFYKEADWWGRDAQYSRTWGAVATLQVLLILFILGAGTFMYVLRCMIPRVYGLIEIAIGIGIALYIQNIAVGLTSPKGNTAFAILAALYVIVRGYDNVYRSLRSPIAIQRWNDWFFGVRGIEKRL